MLEALKTPENDVRTRAKIELGKRDSAQVVAATKKWAASLDKKDKDYAHHLTEALWVHQWHNVVDEALLKQVLRSPDYHARAAATRVLCYWRDRVKDPLALLKVQVADEHPRVRLEAVRACSFLTTREAGDVALMALEKEPDPAASDAYDKEKAAYEKTKAAYDKTVKEVKAKNEVPPAPLAPFTLNPPARPDYYIKYCLDETLKALDKYMKN